MSSVVSPVPTRTVTVVEYVSRPSDPTTTSASDSSPSSALASTTPEASSSASNESHSNTGAIVGGVVGGVAVIALAVCVVVWLIVRRRRGARTNEPPAPTNAPETSQPAIQPYATTSPVQQPTGPDGQAKGWNQQNAQQRPVSMSPVPQYTPVSHFSGVSGEGARHEASAVNARGTGNNAAELG
ncbi:C6 transcription factor [Colletotrichum chrysophilum]|uniref:C6 transcription factor n=1 Tax=Colletotrichum chrysophilum TaxID=1836956 RepID=A0AAD9AIA5_9PEZI|nr:C6 transcription factor [Colletotrichum chrysophilum]